MEITKSRYAVYGKTANSKLCVVTNDGGYGPMSTGTNEWTDSQCRPKLMTLQEAEAIKQNPKIGYGGNHIGVVEVIIYELKVS